MLGKNFIFIEPPKNATTSIRAVLKSSEVPLYSKIGEIDRHAPAWFVKNVLGPHIWNSLYTFTVVRHPVERIISEFKYSKKVAAPWDGSVQGGENDPYRMACIKLHSDCGNINDYIDLLQKQYCASLARINKQPTQHFHNMHGKYAHPQGFPLVNCMIKTQRSMICSPYGEVLVKKVCRLENLTTDFKEVCDTLGLEFRLPKLNSTSPKKHELSQSSIDIISAIYKDDFEIFGYNQGNPKP